MKVKNIEVSMGVSVEIDGTWYKLGAGVTLDNDSQERSPELRKKAFEQAYNELEENIEERIYELKG
ncbi:MAG: hypothetical protein AWU54_1238 [Candidatus Frackibacter sp. T328-2]|jgi:hypothetical protein|nr:MAG: hypothetical protein AWU54_1238 [Candidatus Frackibacter sp. T328-2]